jgi:transposase
VIRTHLEQLHTM